MLNTPLEAVSIGKSPSDNATAIAVLDSGILSNHPLLRNAVGDEIAVGTRYGNKIEDDKPVDDVGHGTKVSGIAMYGDIKQELAKKLKLVFVVSTGNFGEYKHKGFPDSYPDYLLENAEDVKIIDPATSALSITVGSVTQPYGPLNRHQRDLFFSPADTHYPSPFTRVGPGYQGMIKPEVVEEGGNVIEDGRGVIPDMGGKLITLNPDWLSEGRLFSVDHGTSFSTPKVANYIARLFNKYPHASPNLIKALLLSSAQIPKDRPNPLSTIDFKASDKKLIELLQIYGYGKPNFNRAAFSSGDWALLINEGQLTPNSIDVYYVYLPSEFIETKGKKTLSVTLVYDPPVNKNRIDYMGCAMEFHLFKNVEVSEVIESYGPIAGTSITETLNDEDTLPQPLKNKELKLHPGVILRKKGVHQKGIIEYPGPGKPGLDTNKPLVLVVVCQNRWIKAEDYLQDYAVVVAAEHSMNIDLLNRIKTRNQVRVRATLGRM
ncbi:MAG: hypothetical protein B6243_11245 [Anaerolineaceae bacterium 4572_5.2]|nr:MAG: hypothetical protein B6243_11245 [Anaerolineaceae bacterium 4572_5.2]